MTLLTLYTVRTMTLLTLTLYSVRTMTLLTLYSVRVSVARLRERVMVPVCESILK